MNTSKYDLLELDEILDQARRIAEGEDPFDSTNTPITMGDADDDDDVDGDTDDVWGGFAYSDLFPDDTFRDNYTEAELTAIGNHDKDELIGVIEDWDGEKGDPKASIPKLVKQALALQEVVSDEDGDEDEEEDTSIVLDEDEMDEMSIKDLRQLADQLNVDHDGLKRGDLIAALIEANEK